MWLLGLVIKINFHRLQMAMKHEIIHKIPSIIWFLNKLHSLSNIRLENEYYDTQEKHYNLNY